MTVENLYGWNDTILDKCGRYEMKILKILVVTKFMVLNALLKSVVPRLWEKVKEGSAISYI